jgi:cell wall-associated NlpC family hydrolase
LSGRELLVANVAEQLAGAPFKMHGRDPETGIDCVGLVLCALRGAGVEAPGPGGYALRNLTIDKHLGWVSALQLHDVSGVLRPGDVLLFRLPAAQFHLGVVSTRGALIHAHAGLRRVVVTSPPFAWRVDRHWRLSRSGG